MSPDAAPELVGDLARWSTDGGKNVDSVAMVPLAVYTDTTSGLPPLKEDEEPAIERFLTDGCPNLATAE
jgi:hypothetical protein